MGDVKRSPSLWWRTTDAVSALLSPAERLAVSGVLRNCVSRNGDALRHVAGLALRRQLHHACSLRVHRRVPAGLTNRDRAQRTRHALGCWRWGVSLDVSTRRQLRIAGTTVWATPPPAPKSSCGRCSMPRLSRFGRLPPGGRSGSSRVGDMDSRARVLRNCPSGQLFATHRHSPASSCVRGVWYGRGRDSRAQCPLGHRTCSLRPWLGPCASSGVGTGAGALSVGATTAYLRAVGV